MDPGWGEFSTGGRPPGPSAGAGAAVVDTSVSKLMKIKTGKPTSTTFIINLLDLSAYSIKCEINCLLGY